MRSHTLKANFEPVVLLQQHVRLFDRSGFKGTSLVPQSEPSLLLVAGAHPAVIKVALSAVAWFLAVAWLDFSGGPEVDFNLAIITGFFVMFFTLFLLAASMVIDDPRWKQGARFVEFLNDQNPRRQGNHAGQLCPDRHSVTAGVPRCRRNADWSRLAPAIVGASLRVQVRQFQGGEPDRQSQRSGGET